MSSRILVRPHGFQVLRGKSARVVDELNLKLGDSLAIFVGFLLEHPRAGQGVPIDDIRKLQVFRRVRTQASLRRIVNRYIGRVHQLTLGGAGPPLHIHNGTGVLRGSLRVSVAKGSTVELSNELKAIVAANVNPGTEPWRSLPEHHPVHLHRFAAAIQEAAKEFDEGRINMAQTVLQRAIETPIDPRYRSVILMRLARACFRLGEESDAERHLAEATRLVAGMQEPDPVLLARIHYNHAWFAYQKGDFSYKLIDRAEAELTRAGPDDIRSGYVATLRGLFVVKDIEQHHAGLSDAVVESRGHEAIRYLMHAIYLLVRSEDFWGSQEACWNLAYGLFIIGNLDAVQIPVSKGLLGRDTQEILDWLKVSEDISDHHHTGSDSIRLHVLQGSIQMTRLQALAEANRHLRAAERLAKSKPITARERGRLFERRIRYYLEMAKAQPQEEAKHQQSAINAYEEAERQWRKSGLESLITNELEARYRRHGGRISRKG